MYALLSFFILNDKPRHFNKLLHIDAFRVKEELFLTEKLAMIRCYNHLSWQAREQALDTPEDEGEIIIICSFQMRNRNITKTDFILCLVGTQ